MALPINIEDLLNKRRIESNRIEFKAGWNPDKIYHTICAFATDLENIGGGYILVGAEEENGIAKRPVKGLAENEIDRILKDMVGYDTKISPPYLSKVSPEEVDGKTILVIWVPAGVNRPYSVTESVVAKKSVPKFYIRSKSSTIEAKGEILDEVTSTGQKYVLDNELGRRLGQMSVQVEETVNQCVIIKKVELGQMRVYQNAKYLMRPLFLFPGGRKFFRRPCFGDFPRIFDFSRIKSREGLQIGLVSGRIPRRWCFWPFLRTFSSG